MNIQKTLLFFLAAVFGFAAICGQCPQEFLFYGKDGYKAVATKAIGGNTQEGYMSLNFICLVNDGVSQGPLLSFEVDDTYIAENKTFIEFIFADTTSVVVLNSHTSNSEGKTTIGLGTEEAMGLFRKLGKTTVKGYKLFELRNSEIVDERLFAIDESVAEEIKAQWSCMNRHVVDKDGSLVGELANATFTEEWVDGLNK